MLRSNIEANLEAKRLSLSRYQEEQRHIGAVISKLRKELLYNANMEELVQYQIDDLEEQLEEMEDADNE